MDEVHFQQYGLRCRMWVPSETKDPGLLHHPMRRSVGYFDAVRLRDGKLGLRRETDKFNALSCWQFLKPLRAPATRTAQRVVLIVDNARFHPARLHRPWREEHADRFVRDFLPAYRPDLNPSARVWKLTRRRCLHNRYFAHLDEVILAVEAEFAGWIKPNNTMPP